MKTVIETSNVFFKYDDCPILENINFKIEQNEFVAIFGPNGGGKTTLLKLLMGFLKPSSGSIKIFDQTPLKARLQIGYVPQAASFDKQFPISALEVVLMGALGSLTPFGTFPSSIKKKAQEALDLVGLIDFQKRPFGTLSGGQAQRVLIARAILSEPQVLLLDEPTASVDAQAEKEIYQLLASLKGKMTILMVTHDIQSVVNRVGRFICVQRTLSSLTATEMCEHYKLGLYHPQ